VNDLKRGEGEDILPGDGTGRVTERENSPKIFAGGAEDGGEE